MTFNVLTPISVAQHCETFFHSCHLVMSIEMKGTLCSYQLPWNPKPCRLGCCEGFPYMLRK